MFLIFRRVHLPNSLWFSAHFQSVRALDPLNVTHFFTNDFIIHEYSSIFYENKTAYFIYVLVKSHNHSIRNLKLSYSNEDLKMKKLLLNLLVVMSRDLAALQVSHTLTQLLFKFG